MDETGFRVGIPGGEQVSSVTVVEAVSASGKVIPPVLIIQGKTHMESWYHINLHGTERMMLSDSGYINDELAMEWLQHFIDHTGSSRDSEPKVLLLDSHASRHYPPFAILAEKHLRTIVHAFENAGMWPVDSTVALNKIKKYSRPEKLPQTPARIPATLRDSEEQLQNSSITTTSTAEVLAGAQLQEYDYSVLQKQVTEHRNHKSKSRRTLQLGGALTAADAHQAIQLKAQKEADKQAKQVARAAKSAAVQAYKELHRAGVDARKRERERKKMVATLMRAKEMVPPCNVRGLLPRTTRFFRLGAKRPGGSDGYIIGEGDVVALSLTIGNCTILGLKSVSVLSDETTGDS
ncbi:hypothetical protein V501_03673 [Pseudogymnoascus sp. VKM F-4519 (FW-2642)]|nr:hypothetical protein V501_03673 [Pseudogymnoascus sp. VKM F-4519 (FW-2642)]